MLKAKPELSNRQVAAKTAPTHPTVAKVREELEQKGDVEKFTTSTDTRGRKQPAHKVKVRTPEQMAIAQRSILIEAAIHPLTVKKDGSPLRVVSPSRSNRPPKKFIGGLKSQHTDLLEFAQFIIARVPSKRSKHAGVSIAVAYEDIDEFDLLLGRAKIAIEKWKVPA